jgi:hypothetical protein
MFDVSTTGDTTHIDTKYINAPMLMGVWQDLEYHITHGAPIEHL